LFAGAGAGVAALAGGAAEAPALAGDAGSYALAYLMSFFDAATIELNCR
jgi:hypothetical protein